MFKNLVRPRSIICIPPVNKPARVNEACRIAVEHGGFGMAWIGMVDPQTLDVTAVAWAGLEAKELGEIKSSGRSQGIVGRAIET